MRGVRDVESGVRRARESEWKSAGGAFPGQARDLGQGRLLGGYGVALADSPSSSNMEPEIFFRGGMK